MYMHTIFLFMQPLHASSVSKAEECFKDYNQDQPILVGGKKYVPINTTELQLADPSLHFEVTEIPTICCCSILCKKMQQNGMLLHVGEHLLVASESNEHQVIQASQFFAVCYFNQYHIFVKG